MIQHLKKFSWYILLPLTALLVSALMLCYWLVGTASGSDWTIRKLVSLTGFEITIEDISGTLLSGMSLEGLTFSQPELELEVRSVSGQWSLLSVLGGQLHLVQLHADGVLVKTHDRSTSSSPVSWPSFSLPFPVAVDDFAISNVSLRRQGFEPQPLGDLRFTGLISPLRYHINNLDFSHPAGSLSLTGKLTPRFPYQHKLSANWKFKLDGDQYAGNGNLEGDLTSAKLTHQLTSPAKLQSKGKLGLKNKLNLIEIEPQLLHFDLAHYWTEAIVQFGDFPIVSSGELFFRGTGNDFSITAKTAAKAPSENRQKPSYSFQADQDLASLAGDFLPASVEIEATGDNSGLDISRVDINSASGSGSSSGNVRWTNGISWNLDVIANQLSLAPLLPQWPAEVSGQLSSAGFLKAPTYSIALNSAGVSGSVKGVNFRGQFATTFEPQRIEFESLQVAIGENTLNAKGLVGRENDITWDLNAPQLNKAGYGLTGSLVSRGSFRGSLTSPELSVSASAQDLGFQQWSLKELEASLEADQYQKLTIAASLVRFNGPGMSNANANLSATGTLNDHRIKVAFQSTNLEAQLNAEGRYENLGWQGTVRELDLFNTVIGKWQQDGTAATTISRNHASLKKLCLTQTGGKLCVQASYHPDKTAASAQLTSLPLSILNAHLPESTVATGSLDGKFHFTRDTDGQKGEFSLTTTAAQLAYQREKEQQLEHPAVVSLKGSLNDHRLTASGRITVNDTAEIELFFDSQSDGENTFDSRANVEINHLQWLDAFTNQLEAPAGQIHGTLFASGQLNSPTYSGDLQLMDFSAGLPATGVDLQDGNASFYILDQGAWQLDGSVKAGDGTATITGEGLVAELSRGKLDLDLSGENLALVNLPDMAIKVSPDITFKLDGGASDVSGKLVIPAAEITLKALPKSAVSPTGDEVIVPPLRLAGSESELSVRLDVSLGKKVHVQGYGLDTLLAGDMTYRRRTSGATQARGQIELRNGTFEAYGQNLKITRGHLIFQGDIENPGLNFIAVRETPTADVGLRITGVLKEFDSEVFSDPALPSTDALVLLVTGKPPNAINQSEASLVISAATALGVSQSEWITSRLQNSFGLDVLSLEGGDTYEESSLVVGKQLSPKLYVSYVQNLFSPTSSFILQYQINEKLGLKAESGENHSIDIHYKIEH